MKNKKTILGSSAAIVAAVALIGGGTFANWSDFATVVDSEATAGELVLDADHATALNTVETGLLAPGENKKVFRYITNRSDDTVALQDAALTIDIFNVRDHDNGCSSDGEAAAEQGHEGGLGNGSPDNNICNHDGGELSEEAYLQIRRGTASTSIDDPTDCAAGGSSPVADMSLADWGASVTPVNLGTLDPGEGLCVVFEFGLPNGEGGGTNPPGIDYAGGAESTNASQGDSAEFDLRFDLTQVIN